MMADDEFYELMSEAFASLKPDGVEILQVYSKLLNPSVVFSHEFVPTHLFGIDGRGKSALFMEKVP